MTRTSTLKTIVFGFLAATIAMAAHVAPSAYACGFSPEELTRIKVERTIFGHINAVRKGDPKGAMKFWASNGQLRITSADGKNTMRSEHIQRALIRWSKKPDANMKAKIVSLNVDSSSKTAIAKLEVTWHTKTFNEYLTVSKFGGQWKLTDKAMRGRDENLNSAPAKTNKPSNPYGIL